jgi:hypothetical protein
MNPDGMFNIFFYVHTRSIARDTVNGEVATWTASSENRGRIQFKQRRDGNNITHRLYCPASTVIKIGNRISFATTTDNYLTWETIYLDVVAVNNVNEVNELKQVDLVMRVYAA